MKLILVRGLPGSGKSTIAKKLGILYHYEADQYFIKDGEYVFDATKLHRAHSWCQSMVRDALVGGHDVVVSNTFTTIKELRPYFDMAAELGIVPNVIVAQGNFKNVHNVPEESLKRMRDRFVWDISELYNGQE